MRQFIFKLALLFLINLWNQVNGYKLVKTLSQDYFIMHLKALNDNFLASVDQLGTVKVWNVSSGEAKYTFNLSTGDYPFSVHSPMTPLNNNLLATSLNEYDILDNLDFLNRYFIKIWDLKTGKLKYRFDETTGGHNASIECITLLENGYLASADSSGVIKIWDLEKFNLKYTFYMKKKVIRLVSLGHNYVAAGDLEGETRVFDIELGKFKYSLTGLVQSQPGESFNSNVNDMAELENGYLAVAYSGGYIKVWDILNGKLKYYLGENRPWVNRQPAVRVVIALTDGYFASGDSNGIIKIWDITNGKLTSTFGSENVMITNLIELEDGRVVSSDNFGTIKIWNPHEGKLLHKFDTSNGANWESVWKLAVLDNDYLTSGNWKNGDNIQIWDINP